MTRYFKSNDAYFTFYNKNKDNIIIKQLLYKGDKIRLKYEKR